MADIDYDESRTSTIVAVVISVLSIAFVILSLRVYTRAILIRNLGIDDWCCIVAFVVTAACGMAVLLSTRHGLGKHQETLSKTDIKAFMKAFYFSIVFYNIALAAIKLTLLFQYFRAMTTHKLKKVYIAALVIVGAWSISQIFVYVFACRPIALFWDKSLEGSCISNNPSWYINAAGNIFTDLLILVLPLPIIRKLQLGRRQKYILMSIFCLGFFTCAISVVRLFFLHVQEDVTWHNVDPAGWSTGELCCGIICACLPTLRPLVSRHFPKLSSHNRSSARTHTTSGGPGVSQSYHAHNIELGHFSNRCPSVHSSESKDVLFVETEYSKSKEVHTEVHLDITRDNGIGGKGNGGGTNGSGKSQTIETESISSMDLVREPPRAHV